MQLRYSRGYDSGGTVFVKALVGESATWGIGKQVDQSGDLCTVEYFNAPSSDRITVNLSADAIAPVRIPEQARIYHFDAKIGAWEIGRLLDDHGDQQLVQFPNKVTRLLDVVDVYARWSQAIDDPTPFLANFINESPRFSDGRSAFTRSQMNQRAASLGMSALLSSAIELESHQVEVVRRVLQDPVQRYLLADEVGLGKTIEAGILIRQCVLDCGPDITIVIIVPDALVLQWRNELSEKFLLGASIGKAIHIVSAAAIETAAALLSRAVMLVIDEAHHLVEQGEDSSIYAVISAAAPSIDRVLLLSATPVLHNERSFLAMLHILDPANYRLDRIDEFRARIASRQPLAEIVAGLIPENALYLDHSLDALAELFPTDTILQDQINVLRRVVDRMPAEDDPDLVDAVSRLKAHIGEVYRLDRRILRHRRRNVSGLTPERAGTITHRYSSADRQSLTVAINDWTFAEGVALNEAGGESRRRRSHALWQIHERAAQYAVSGAGMVGFLARREEMVGDLNRFGAIARALTRPGMFDDRVAALVEALAPELDQGSKCVVFCSDGKTADAVATALVSGLGCPVDRHSAEADDWFLFNDDPSHRVLVCDRQAEEGLNLQGGRKLVAHFDTPLNPNRLEQRLGRVDRYGSGEAVRSLLLVCEDDPFEVAWTRYVDEALRVFDRSVASLQFLIDTTVRGLPQHLFDDGIEALRRLVDDHAGTDGKIEAELKAIDRQDALDALGTPPSDLTDRLCDLDNEWRGIADDTNLWLEQTLMFGCLRQNEGTPVDPRATPFRYRYLTERGHTLLPLPTFLEHCAGSLDFIASARFGRAIKTAPFSFQRRAVVSRQGRAAGLRLLRYGEPFLAGVSAITDGDDRGRSFALWREVGGYAAEHIADIYLRFDFIAEVDLGQALLVLGQSGVDSVAARAALRRRGDLVLPPRFSTIWLNSSLAPVHDPELREILEAPYLPDHRSGRYRDTNVNARRWQRVKSMRLDPVAHWSELCRQGRERAETCLRSDPEFLERLRTAGSEAAVIDVGRISQLEVRERQNPDAGTAQVVIERSISAKMREGILQPSVRLETIGSVFLTGDSAAASRIVGGE